MFYSVDKVMPSVRKAVEFPFSELRVEILLLDIIYSFNVLDTPSVRMFFSMNRKMLFIQIIIPQSVSIVWKRINCTI